MGNMGPDQISTKKMLLRQGTHRLLPSVPGLHNYEEPAAVLQEWKQQRVHVSQLIKHQAQNNDLISGGSSRLTNICGLVSLNMCNCVTMISKNERPNLIPPQTLVVQLWKLSGFIFLADHTTHHNTTCT